MTMEISRRPRMRSEERITSELNVEPFDPKVHPTDGRPGRGHRRGDRAPSSGRAGSTVKRAGTIPIPDAPDTYKRAAIPGTILRRSWDG